MYFVVEVSGALKTHLSSVLRNLSKNGNLKLRVCDLNWLRPAPTKLLQQTIDHAFHYFQIKIINKFYVSKVHCDFWKYQ